MDNINSWQLEHLSPQLLAGDYSLLKRPKGVQWSVRTIIPMDNGIVSVEHTRNDKCYWILPGGGIERGELIIDAAKREVYEETSLIVEVERLLYIRESSHHQSVEFYVLAHYRSGEMLMNPPDGDDPFLTNIGVISFERLERDKKLIFYPETISQRLKRDIILPPATALYLGAVP